MRAQDRADEYIFHFLYIALYLLDLLSDSVTVHVITDDDNNDDDAPDNYYSIRTVTEELSISKKKSYLEHIILKIYNLYVSSDSTNRDGILRYIITKTIIDR